MSKIDCLLKNCYRKEDIDTKIIFYQTPKFLIHSDTYKELGLAEKLVYSVLRDRLELSLNNEKEDFVDENGYVFLRFDQEKLGQLLNINKKTVGRYMKKLEEYELIVIVREGQGKSNRIYITDISKQLEKIYTYENIEENRQKNMEESNESETIENTLKGQNVTSRKDKMSLLEVTKSPHNDTDIINTDFSDTKSVSQFLNSEDIKNGEIKKEDKNEHKKECKNFSVRSERDLQSGAKEFFSQDCKYFSPNNTNISDTEYKSISQSKYSDDKKTNKEIKKDRHTDNISTYLMEDYNKTIINCELHAIDEKYQAAIAHAIKLLYLDIENKKKINIGDSIIPVEILKKDMDKLNFFILEHAVNKFKEASREKVIKNKIGYLKACIYNSIHEIDVDIDGELRYQGLI